MDLTDQQIAARAGEGEVNAFVQLVERYRAPLIGYLCGLGSAKDQAEELAQEAFCRVWEKLPTLRQKQRLVSWLYRIAHNLAVVAHISDRVGVVYLGKMVEIGEARDITEAPKHPYTKALISAIPVPTPGRQRSRIILEGDVPSPANPPSGCRFHPRCPAKIDVCAQLTPPLIETSRRHYSACHLSEGMPANLP